jgi:uncharacterized protein
MSGEGFVAVLVIELHFPEAGSLKAKRKDLASIKALLHGRFGASVAETAHQDLWQRSTLTAALAAGSPARLGELTDAVERWLVERCPAGVRIDRLIVSVDDLRDVISPRSAGLGG